MSYVQTGTVPRRLITYVGTTEGLARGLAPRRLEMTHRRASRTSAAAYFVAREGIYIQQWAVARAPHEVIDLVTRLARDHGLGWSREEVASFVRDGRRHLGLPSVQ